jgi:hypothetical protein
LCLAIIGLPRFSNCVSEEMWVTALCHAEVVRELAMLQAAVSSVVKLVLGHSPDETLQVEDMDELVAEFQRLEELFSRLERPGTRIYDLVLGLPLGQA